MTLRHGADCAACRAIPGGQGNDHALRGSDCVIFRATWYHINLNRTRIEERND